MSLLLQRMSFDKLLLLLLLSFGEAALVAVCGIGFCCYVTSSESSLTSTRL
jgi:uncharacterized membrane protein